MNDLLHRLLQKHQHLNIFDQLLSCSSPRSLPTVAALHQNLVYSQKIKINVLLPMATKLYSFSLFTVLSANQVVRSPHEFGKPAFYTYRKTDILAVCFPGS